MVSGGSAGRGVARSAFAVMVAALLALAPILPSRAADAPSGDPQTPEQVLALFADERVPIDFFLVVDTSKSMLDPPKPTGARGAIDAMKAFAASVPEGDRTTVILFDQVPSPRAPITVKDPADRAKLASILTFKSFRGNYTDIGEALRSVQGYMGSPLTATHQEVLVFLSDGDNNPPPGSDFSRAPGNGAWKRLAVRGHDITQNRSVAIEGIGVGTTAGVQLVRVAFPGAGANVSPAEPNQIAARFEQIIADAEVNSIRPAVERDLQRDLDVVLTVTGDLAPETPATLSVTNNRQKLDTAFDLSTVSVTDTNGDDVPVVITGEKQLTLAPGETKDVSVTLSPPGVDTSPHPGVASESRSFTASVDGQLSTPAQSPTHPLLAQMKLGTPEMWRRPVQATATASATREYGIPWWKVVLLILVVLLIAALIIRTVYLFIKKPPLIGQVKQTEPVQGPAVGLRGTTFHVPGSVSISNAGLNEVKLHTKARPWRRTTVYVKTVKGSARLTQGRDRMGAAIPTDKSIPISAYSVIRLDRAAVQFQQVPLPRSRRFWRRERPQEETA